MKVFNKKERQTDKYHIKMPTDLKYYLHLPKIKIPGHKEPKQFNWSHIGLYLLIVDYWNEEKGYAWVGECTLSLYHGKTTRQLRTDIKMLEQVELLDVVRRQGETNLYTPLEPLSKEELFKKYPEAKENFNKKGGKLEEERQENWRKFEEWKRQQNVNLGF